MMISSPSAGGPYAAAAALDRALRTDAGPAADADPSSDDTATDASPDVVVRFSSGSSAPATYDAAGKMAGTPSLDDMGANAFDSLAHARESVHDDTAPDPAGASQAAPPATVDA